MSSSMALRRSPKPGALTAHTLRTPAQPVDDQRGKCLAFDVLRDDQQWPACLRDFFEQRDEVSQRIDLLIAQQDERILENRFHPFRIGDEVG